MQSRLSPDNWQKVSGFGMYQSILNPAVLQICKIGYFSMIEGSCTDFTFVYTVLKIEKWVGGFGTVRCCNHVYIAIFIQGKQIQIKFPEELSKLVICLWELHIALNYTWLWWVSIFVFCDAFRKYFSICFSDIYYTMCFNYSQHINLSSTKKSRVQLVLGMQRGLGVQIRRSFVTIRDWSENIQ